MHPTHYSRRRFVVMTGAALGGVALGSSALHAPGSLAGPATDPLPPRAYLPLMMASMPPLPLGRVIHVHAASAVDWSGQSDYYNCVNATAVAAMVERGLLELTGAADVAGAWRRLIPGYHTGQKIAIKVNFNNNYGLACQLADENINPLIEPVNTLAASLATIGVAPSDIFVYDAVRALTERFVSANFSGSRFFDKTCHEPATFTDVAANRIVFHHPGGAEMPTEIVTDVLMGADYLINMPIMKGSHGYAGVTLGFKNHFGTISYCADLHDFINCVGKPAGYREDYNPLVDLLRSPLIGGKTVLTVGDGLFAAKDYQAHPVTWSTFGDEVPKSLFFSNDPVAADCVMHDFLAAELGTVLVPDAKHYLELAGAAGLGVFESIDPWTSSYSAIQYRRIEV